MRAVHHGSTRPAPNGKWCQTSCSARQLTSGWAGCWYKTQRCCDSSQPPLAVVAFILRCAAICLALAWCNGRAPVQDPCPGSSRQAASVGKKPRAVHVGRGSVLGMAGGASAGAGSCSTLRGEEKEGDEVAGPVSSPLAQLQRLGVRGSLSSGEVKQLKPLPEPWAGCSVAPRLGKGGG